MAQDSMLRAAPVSRRGVVTGLTFGFVFAGAMVRGGPADAATESAAPGAGASAAAKLEGAWVKIASDGAIEIAYPAIEMGQGSMTGLTMVIAEELDADWSRVAVFIPPNLAETYGNPHWGGTLTTVGSFTIMGYWDKVRLQGAAMRRVLMQAAADQWGVPLAELRTEPSVVVHDASGRRLSYGEIAGFATVPSPMPAVTKADLKHFADYRIIGTAPPRFDVPAKSDGSAMFGIDIRLPNMAYATFLGSPVEGATPQSVDGSRALKVPGVTQVATMPAGVAIVGDSVEAVFAGRELVDVTWSKGERDSYNSVDVLQQYQKRAADHADKGVPWHVAGDVDQAFSGAAKVVRAEYTTDHVYHAQLEPLGVTASVNEAGDGAQIWVSTQAQTAAAGAVAGLLKTTPDKIIVNHQYAGGGFGRRSAVDFLPEAVLLSKQLKRPVKMVWKREQDVRAAKMRPMTAHAMEAAFDATGALTGWRHRIVAESIIAYRSEKGLEAVKGADFLVMVESEPPYAIPNQAVTYHREKHGSPLSAYRGIGAGHNVFALESFFDELAAEQKIDPVQYRLKLMADNPRALAVIRATAEMADWGKPSAPGRAKGFAFGKLVETWIAGVIEVSIDRDTGEIRAHHFWTTLDPGVAVNLDSIRAQTEGNVVFGLSGALKERVTLADGRVEQNNFYDYEVLRMSEVPEIHIAITPTDNPPAGIGEAAIPLIAPCVSNAVFALTGKRLRSMPFNMDRVKAALATV